MPRPTLPLLLSLTTAVFAFMPSLSSAHELVTYCPGAGADGADDNVSPFDLIWDVSGGTTLLAPDDAIEVLFGANLAPDSTCRIDAHVTTRDGLANVLSEDSVLLDAQNRLEAVTRTFDIGSFPNPLQPLLFVDIDGTATGCTRSELQSFSVNEAVLQPPEADGSDTRVNKVDAFSIKQRLVHTAVFRRLAAPEDPYAPPVAVGPALELSCPGGKPIYADSGDRVSPFDLIWDLDTGTTSASTADDSSLVVFVTPYILNDACPGPDGRAFVPRVTVEIVITDETGQQTIVNELLDASRPFAVVDFPDSSDGARTPYLFDVEARSPDCIAARGGVVGATLYTFNAEFGTVEEAQRLPVTVRRNPFTGEPVPIP